jgi:hypothetical protein
LDNGRSQIQFFKIHGWSATQAQVIGQIVAFATASWSQSVSREWAWHHGKGFRIRPQQNADVAATGGGNGLDCRTQKTSLALHGG